MALSEKPVERGYKDGELGHLRVASGYGGINVGKGRSNQSSRLKENRREKETRASRRNERSGTRLGKKGPTRRRVSSRSSTLRYVGWLAGNSGRDRPEPHQSQASFFQRENLGTERSEGKALLLVPAVAAEVRKSSEVRCRYGYAKG